MKDKDLIKTGEQIVQSRGKGGNSPVIGEEVWLPIKGYEGLYEISSFGRVKSVEHKVAHPSVLGNGGMMTVRERMRRPNIMKGYHCIALKADGKTKVYRIHRLVAEHFISAQPTPEHQINHIDGDKSNNHVSNLEWVLPVENTRHAIRNGLRKPPSEETKRKMGEASKRMWQDDDFRANYSEMMVARWKDPEYRERTLHNMRGKVRTPEQRAHYAAVVKETRPVINITTGEHFKSRRLAAEKYGRTPEAISAAILGKTKRCAGCEWRYADEE